MLRVFGGGAVKGLVGALAPEFEAKHGWRIDGTFSAVGAMRERVIAGEPVDVVILTRPLIDELARDGYVLADTVADLGRVLTGLAVRAGDQVPAIADAAALAALLTEMDAIYTADPLRATAGIHFAKVVAELGLTEAIAPRLHGFATGTEAMRELAAARGGRRPQAARSRACRSSCASSRPARSAGACPPCRCRQADSRSSSSR